MLKNGLIIGALGISLLASAPARSQQVPGLIANTQGSGTPSGLIGDMAASPCSYTNPFGLVPKFNPDMWKQVSASRLGPGTVLTGIMDDTISSSSSKPGDIFSIRLQDGFIVNGTQVIPPQSKIIGTVIAAKSAKISRTGMPGSLDISLQTLVFPDGRTTAFYGYIQHNPAQDMKTKPGSEPLAVAGYAKRGLTGLLSLGTGRLGMPVRLPSFGQELKITKGEAIPLRLSRSIDLARMTPAPQTVQAPQGANPMQLDPDSLMQPSGLAPGLAPARGLAAPPALSLSGSAPSAPPVAPPRLTGSSDPNAIFSNPPPPQQPRADLPDPF